MINQNQLNTSIPSTKLPSPDEGEGNSIYLLNFIYEFSNVSNVRLLYEPSAARDLPVEVAALSVHQDLISLRGLGTTIKVTTVTAQHTVYRIPSAVIPLHLVRRHLAIWRNIDPYADVVLK